MLRRSKPSNAPAVGPPGVRPERFLPKREWFGQPPSRRLGSLDANYRPDPSTLAAPKSDAAPGTPEPERIPAPAKPVARPQRMLDDDTLG